MENTDTHDHDHGHDEELLEEAIEPNAPEPVMLDNTVDRSHGHEHSGIDGLLEVMFGFEHVVAEFFWNGVFILTTFLITKAFALRKIHKYVDDKHGVKHKKEEY